MSLTASEMTPADFAAVTNGNDGFGGGNGAWWLIILFLFAFGGWGGYGRGGYGGYGGGQVGDNYILATDMASLSRQISDATASTERRFDNVTNGLCDGFYTQAQLVNGVNLNMSNGFANAELSRANQQAALMAQLNANNIAAMQNQNALQAQIAQCCCDNRYDALKNSTETQNAINSGFCQTNFNNATNTRDIIDSQASGTRAILEKLAAMESNAKDQRIAEQAQQINALQLAASQAAQNQYLVQQLRPAPVPAFTVNPPYQFTGCGCNCNC